MIILKNKSIKLILFYVLLLFTFTIAYIHFLRKFHLEYKVTHSKFYENMVILLEKKSISKSDIIVLGDSRYTKLKINSHKFLNLSIRGETSHTMLNRISNYVFKDSINIIFGVGVNDVLFSYKTQEILDNLNLLINLLSKKTNSSVIHLCKIIPINSSGFFHQKKIINQKIQDINNFFDTLDISTNKNKKKIVDFNVLVDKNNNLDMDYSDDGIHLNLKGLLILKNHILISVYNE